MKVLKTSLTHALLALLALYMISIAPARAADIVLKASHNANQDEPYHSGMERMGELLKQKTGDKAEIQVFANAQLGDEMESVQGTQLGIVDIAVTANEVMANFAPDMSVFGLPYLFKDAEHMDRAVGSKQVHDQVDQILTAKGYRLLGIFFAGTRHIMSKRPIGSINDIKGMKIRTLNNPIHIEAFKSFGANPTPMPYTELYGALETGVVDGAEAANTNYHSRKFYEVAPNWAMTGWIEMVSPVVIGAAKFDSLPKDIQTALLEAGAEASKMERKVYRDSDQQRLAQLKQLKVNITHPDIEAFRSASQKIYESYVKTDGQKQLLQTIRTMD